MKILNILLFLIVTISFQSQAKSQIIHVGVKADLVKTWNKVNSEYLLIKSPPYYQELDTTEATKGFKVVLSETIKGQHTREIYDYSKNQSSFNVYKQITASITSSDYKVIFSCAKVECGKVAGWGLFLSNLISGSEDKQFFGVAKKLLHDGKVEYISYYITEIESQPRVLVDILVTPKKHNFDFLIKSEQVNKDIMKDGRVVLEGLNFTVGSSELNNDSEYLLKAMSVVIKKHPKNLFAIVGHTDSTGEYKFNIELSQQRANTVRSALINKYNINAKHIIASGVGPLTPLTSNNNQLGRTINRRVELVQL